jgi:GNAT superfamily N-acetyltransferase
VNVNTLDEREAFAREATPVDYGAESAAARVARRVAQWTPADLVTCRFEPADAAVATSLLTAFFDELAVVLGGFDPARSVSADPQEMAPPNGAFVILEENGKALGCGGLKTHAPGIGEIKRMYLVPEARGRGLGREVLCVLEEKARNLGMRRAVLDTAAPLAAASALYRAAGYREVAPFNANPYAARWFAKDLC